MSRLNFAKKAADNLKKIYSINLTSKINPTALQSLLKKNKNQNQNIIQSNIIIKTQKNYNQDRMGGNSSSPTRKVKHFYFGDVVKKKSFNKEVLVVTHPIINKEQFDDWKQKYDQVHNMNKEYILVPEDYQFRKIKNAGPSCGGCCGAENQYEMTYDNVDFSLYSQILNRKQLKKMYSQPQLLKLLYNLVQGTKQFQKKSLKVGDIRTKNILITKQGQIKIVNVASFPSERTNVQKVLDGFDNTTVFYFAPEQVQYVKGRGSANSQFPNSKSEAWSVGLCILQAATLQCSEEIYQMPSRKINQITFNKRLKKVQQSYPILFIFLGNIAKINNSQRMTTGQCWASLRPYSQKITELQLFKRDPTAENNSIRKYQTQGSSKY